MRQYIIVVFLIVTSSFFAQKINVDSLYYEARDLYKTKAYEDALVKTNQALIIAPNYIDIRILQIRIEQQTKRVEKASYDIGYLLNNNDTVLVKPLAIKHFYNFKNKERLARYIELTNTFFEDNIDYKLAKTESLLLVDERKLAKEELSIIMKFPRNDKQNYTFHVLLKKLSKNQIGINHEILSFLKEYPTQKTWNTTNIEYLHYFGLSAATVRFTYSDRAIKEGLLYEIESYPVLSKKWYGYVNFSVSSKSDFFQNYGSKISLYHTLNKGIEIEAGFRYLNFDEDSFFTSIGGLSLYKGNYYINLRAFIGPKFKDEFIQNYQLNTRYYLKNAEDYVFIKLGTGIAPDQSSQVSSITSYSNYNSYYTNLGIHKWIGNYNLQVALGYLYEELPNNKTGNQINTTVGCRYRF